MRILLALAALLVSCVAVYADPAIPMKAARSAAPAEASAVTAGTAESALPDGRALLRQFINACGGVNAFAKVQNLEMRGTLAIPAQGMSGSIVIYQAKPNKVLAVTELGPIKMEQGFDGTTGWARDPVQGPRILEGAELEQLKSSGGEIEVFGYSNPDEYFTSATTLARTTFESKDAWKVALTTKGGEKLIAYFDPATMLQLGLETTINSAMGEIPIVVSMSDWRDFSGMKMPAKLTQNMMGMAAFTTIDAMNVNISDLPSFAPPTEVTESAQ